MSEFVEVDVESQGISMRWKRAGEPRDLHELDYESEDGVGGTWRAFALDDDDGAPSGAHSGEGDDSSDGVVLLVFGGRAGLLLAHETGVTERAPYLLLSRTTKVR